MGGNKDERSYSQRSGGSGGGGGGSVSEAGALFPRLHVKETKRVGPRAPPRNKMALYEQFTFPSSRYVPPSMAVPSSGHPSPTPISTTPYAPQQRSSYEGSLFYGLSPSFGVMPWMPYAAMSNTSTGGGPQPSLNGSSGSTIVDCETDMRHRADSARQSSSMGGQATVWTCSQSNASGVSRKRTYLDDTSSAPTAPGKDVGGHETAADALGIEKLTWQPWQQRSAETPSKSGRISASSDCQVESSGLASFRTNRGAKAVNEIVRHDEGVGKEGTRKGEKKRHDVEESDGQDRDAVEKGKDRSHEVRKSAFGDIDGSVTLHARQGGHHAEKKKSSQADGDVGSKVPKGHAPGIGDSPMVAESDDQGSSWRRKVTSGEGRTPVAMRDADKGGNEKGEAMTRIKIVERESRKRGNPSECRSSSFVDGDDETEIISGVQASGRSDSEAVSDGEDSEVSDPQAPRKKRKLSSRHVVKLLGVQEFWRTRDLLQRQQKIFSEQVFEMHRLLKVQQMFMSAADQVIDEETVGGAGEVPEETSDPDNADEQMAAEEEEEEEQEEEDEPEEIEALDIEALDGGKEAAAAAVVAISEDPKIPEKVAEKQQDTCQSSTSHKACAQAPIVETTPKQDKAGASTMPSVGPGESTASWTHPSGPKPDVNNWYGAAIPAPGGAFMYQPYPGAFPPPQAHAIGTYPSPYGPIMCAPGGMDVSGMTPYGMPRYEQRMDMIPEMYRYGSFQQQWPPAMICPPVPSNPGAGWYGVPAPIPYMDPVLRGGWYEEMTPGGSAHPSGSSSYHRPPSGHGTSSNGIPAPRAAAFVMQPAPWPPEVAQRHHPGTDADKFRNQQAQWTGGNEGEGQIASLGPQKPAASISGSGNGNTGSLSVGGGFQRPPPRLIPQESIGTHSAAASYKGIGLSWGLGSSGNDFLERGSNAAETPDHAISVAKDKEEERKHKKNRGESRLESAKETHEADVVEIRLDAGSTDATEAQRDALPLFPLVPVLNTLENRRLASQSSGVIKVVPRAVAATAESAAEILLSIQKPRQL